MSYAGSACRTCGSGATLAQWEVAPAPPTGLPFDMPPPTGGLPSTDVPGGATTPPGYVPDPSAEPPAAPGDPTEPAEPGLRTTDPANGGGGNGSRPLPPGAPPPDGFLGQELMGWAVGMAVGALLLARTR